jgi:hypothetical protein
MRQLPRYPGSRGFVIRCSFQAFTLPTFHRINVAWGRSANCRAAARMNPGK